MASFIEQATLRINDQSSRPIAKINRELKDLFRTARNGRKITIEMPNLAKHATNVDKLSRAIRVMPRSKSVAINVTGVTEAQRRLSVLRNARGATFNIRATGERAAINSINRVIARLQLMRNTSNFRLPVAPTPTTAQTGTRVAPSSNQGVVSGGFWNNFRNQMSLNNLGRNAGRVPGFGLGGEAYMAARATAITAAVAPLTMEEAENRVRTAGRTPEELAILKEISERLSREVGVINAADILGNVVETTGTFGDLMIPENAAKAEAAMKRMADSAVILVNAMGLSAEVAAEEARKIEKSIQIVGASGDIEQGQRIQEAALMASVASGGDLLPSETARMLQQLGGMFVSGLTDEALLQIALARDEGGRMSTGEFRMTSQDFTRGSLNDADKAAQQKVGLRDAQGKSTLNGAFEADPIGVVQNTIIPILEGLGVDLSNAADVQYALDEQVGLTTTGARYIGVTIAQLEERIRELDRAKKTDLDFARDNPTTRAQAQAVNSQFENVAMQAIGPVLPYVNEALGNLSDGLGSMATGEFGASDVAKVAAAAAPVALFASLQAMQNPQTRALGAAGLALTGAAAALTLSAGAITGAAAIGGAAAVGKGALGGRISAGFLGGIIGSAIRKIPAFLRFGTAGVVAVAAGGGAATIPDQVDQFASRAPNDNTMGPFPSLEMIQANDVKLYDEDGNGQVEFGERVAGRFEETLDSFKSFFTPRDNLVERGGSPAASPVLAYSLASIGTPQNVTVPQVAVASNAVPIANNDISAYLKAASEDEAMAVAWNPEAAARIQEANSEMSMQLDMSADNMDDVFIRGSGAISKAGEDMIDSAGMFGPLAAQGMLDAAPQVGLIIANAMRAAAGEVSVKTPAAPNRPIIPTTGPRLDRGGNTPF